MGLASRLPAASPRLSRLRWPRRVAAGGDSGGVSPGHAGPHAGTQRPPPRSFRVSPTRVPVSSVATRKNAVLGLALGRTDLFLARRGWRDLTWPPRSRSHALG